MFIYKITPLTFLFINISSKKLQNFVIVLFWGENSKKKQNSPTTGLSPEKLTNNVSKGPDSLFTDILVRGLE